MKALHGRVVRILNIFLFKWLEIWAGSDMDKLTFPLWSAPKGYSLASCWWCTLCWCELAGLLSLLCVCVCLCGCKRICVCVGQWLCLSVHACVGGCVYVRVCIHVCMHVCMCLYVYTCTCVHACVGVCVWGHVCVSARACVCVRVREPEERDQSQIVTWIKVYVYGRVRFAFNGTHWCYHTLSSYQI